ncbi:hypothetical protein PR048_012834 [Dryococelus australis]|uniref:Uncharacterized protein n=1 Tax=Dryococelus australis TaxID=614101 RepID=A0ABQ9HQF9_9NEOP|nr:hypothetical protein PR048_012834 [Dryococelus australis]
MLCKTGLAKGNMTCKTAIETLKSCVMSFEIHRGEIIFFAETDKNLPEKYYILVKIKSTCSAINSQKHLFKCLAWALSIFLSSPVSERGRCVAGSGQHHLVEGKFNCLRRHWLPVTEKSLSTGREMADDTAKVGKTVKYSLKMLESLRKRTHFTSEASTEQHRNARAGETGDIRENPPATSSSTIPKRENPGATLPENELGSPWWEATPPRPLLGCASEGLPHDTHELTNLRRTWKPLLRLDSSFSDVHEDAQHVLGIFGLLHVTCCSKCGGGVCQCNEKIVVFIVNTVVIVINNAVVAISHAAGEVNGSRRRSSPLDDVSAAGAGGRWTAMATLGLAWSTLIYSGRDPNFPPYALDRVARSAAQIFVSLPITAPSLSEILVVVDRGLAAGSPTDVWAFPSGDLTLVDAVAEIQRVPTSQMHNEDGGILFGFIINSFQEVVTGSALCSETVKPAPKYRTCPITKPGTKSGGLHFWEGQWKLASVVSHGPRICSQSSRLTESNGDHWPCLIHAYILWPPSRFPPFRLGFRGSLSRSDIDIVNRVTPVTHSPMPPAVTSSVEQFLLPRRNCYTSKLCDCGSWIYLSFHTNKEIEKLFLVERIKEAHLGSHNKLDMKPNSKNIRKQQSWRSNLHHHTPDNRLASPGIAVGDVGPSFSLALVLLVLMEPDDCIDNYCNDVPGLGAA